MNYIPHRCMYDIACVFTIHNLKVSINMLKAFLEFDSWQRTTHLLNVFKRNFTEQNNLCVKNDSLRKLVNETKI